MESIEKDFPSLKLGYEQVLDSLKNQAEISRDYSNRAITLFSIAIAILGIGLPILFNSHIHGLPVLLAVIPVIVFVFVYFSFWKVYSMKPMIEIASPLSVISQFITLQPIQFFSESIQHISSAFTENEVVLKKKEKGLNWLIALTLIEVSTLVILTLLFFSFEIG